MPIDLITYIIICIIAAGFIKRVGEVFTAYEAQPIDARSKDFSR